MSATPDEPQAKRDEEFRSNAILLLGLVGGISFAGLAVLAGNIRLFSAPLPSPSFSPWPFPSSHYYFLALSGSLVATSLFAVLGSILLMNWGRNPSDRFSHVFGVFSVYLSVAFFLLALPVLFLKFSPFGGKALMVLESGLLALFLIRFGLKRKPHGPRKG